MMMKKIQFYAPGDIRVEQGEVPTPGKGEIDVYKRQSFAYAKLIKTNLNQNDYQRNQNVGKRC